MSAKSDEKPALEQQIQEKTQDIRKLQQKLELVEKHHKGAAKLCVPQLPLCHKIIQVFTAGIFVSIEVHDVKALLETTIESTTKCLELPELEPQMLAKLLQVI